MSAKHTPGPWGADRADSRGATIRTIDGAFAIATATAARDEVDAKARLIAAAPDLLEALRAMLAKGQTKSERAAVEAAARAAIAKAESQS